MPYPFVVIADEGVHVARVNHDASWSVRWDRVIDVAYAPPHPHRIAVQSMCKLLLAARDNFVLTPWEESDRIASRWSHYQAEMIYLDHEPDDDELQAMISYNGMLVARINHDGSWSMLWDQVVDLARQNNDDFRSIALTGITRLFVAARDRFWTTPWDAWLAEEDEE